MHGQLIQIQINVLVSLEYMIQLCLQVKLLGCIITEITKIYLSANHATILAFNALIRWEQILELASPVLGS